MISRFSVEIGAVVPKQRYPIGNPIFTDQMLGAHQPVAQNFEESALAHFGGSIEIAGKRTDRLLVSLKEQAVLAAKMLENRTLGDPQDRGDIAHPGGVVALLGKMAHRGVDDLAALALRTRPRRHVTVAGRRNDAAANSAHSLTSSQETLPKDQANFNSIFPMYALM